MRGRRNCGEGSNNEWRHRIGLLTLCWSSVVVLEIKRKRCMIPDHSSLEAA